MTVTAYQDGCSYEKVVKNILDYAVCQGLKIKTVPRIPMSLQEIGYKKLRNIFKV